MSALWVYISNSRHAPAVSVEPRASTHAWRILRVGQNTHLAGFLANGVTCRVTTSVIDINLSAREVRTASGRLYELTGPPASDSSQLAVIAIRTRQLGLCVDDDLTADIWSAMQAAMS